MIKDFLRIASIVARQDLAKIISRTTTKKTRLMNVLQWNETIKAYKDKKLKKYSDIHSSCYWKDMTYSEYKGKKGDFRNGFTKKKPKFPKEFEFLNVKIDLTDLEFDNVNVRVCIDSKLYGELNSSGIEACINANVEFEVVFEEYAQINNRLAGLLSKKLNIDPEICSSLLSDDSFYSLCKFYNKNAKQYSNSQFSFSIDNEGDYKDEGYIDFIFKVDTATFIIRIIDVVAKAKNEKLKMIKSRNDRIAYIGDLVEGIDLAKEKLKEINSVYDKVIGNGFDIGFEINNYINGYNYNKTSLQNAITKGKFVDYFVDTVLNLRTIHEYAFNKYISACNDYFELKEISPKYYKEEVFNNAMEQYQKYKEEYDDALIASRKRINDIREYIGNYYNKDTQCKKMILEIALNSTKSMWINRARKKIMNDFKDFKKFCEVYIEFVKKYFNEAIVIKAEQEIAEAIN
jgi:hypothetical protein